MARFQPRKQLFDYGEAEETQYDMVNAVEQAGSWGSGLSVFYQSQDKKMEDSGQGGFCGQFSKKASSPKWKSLSAATKARDKMKERAGFSEDSSKYKQVMSYINPAMGGDMAG